MIYRKIMRIIVAASAAAMLFTGCASGTTSEPLDTIASSSEIIQETSTPGQDAETNNSSEETVGNQQGSEVLAEEFLVEMEGSTEPYVEINGNVPFFSEQEFTQEPFEQYADLDDLGRCGQAYANICEDIMPTEERGEIGMVKPTGWHTVKYDCVDGNYLYNRCHLIGYQLAGENANEKNLITGTRYMNVEGMLPFENMVDDYVEETGNHVLYRVTPYYIGNNLLAHGVLMEAASVEDSLIQFCVYVPNNQPDITIDYSTGDSSYNGETVAEEESAVQPQQGDQTYILNNNSMKYHLPDCSSVDKMSEKNKEEYNGNTEYLESIGYEPCKNCIQ